MKITVEKTPNSEAILDVQLEWEEVEKASDRAYRKLAQRYTVPGFRRGHAPRSMLERMIGKEAIYQEGLDDLINESYKKALAEHQLTPIGEADVDAQPIDPGQPYHFKATVPILSPVTLGDYRSIHFDPPEPTVSEEEVNKVLEDYRNQQAIWVPVERPAQMGDRVTANLRLIVGEKTVSDLKDNEFELVEERPGLFAGLDAELLGTSEGQTKEFSLTIPEDYVNKDLAGKEARYTVTIRAIKQKELPDLDDELAKAAGNYETLAELRQSIHEQLLQSRTSQARRDLEEQVINAALEQTSVEIHRVLIEEEAQHLYDQMKRMLAQQGMSMEQFLLLSHKTEAEYKKELEPEAARQVKIDLLLEAIADQEGLSASDSELQELLNRYQQLGATKVQRITQLSATVRKRLETSIKRDKARKFLIAHATSTPKQTDDPAASASETRASQSAEATETGQASS